MIDLGTNMGLLEVPSVGATADMQELGGEDHSDFANPLQGARTL